MLPQSTRRRLLKLMANLALGAGAIGCEPNDNSGPDAGMGSTGSGTSDGQDGTESPGFSNRSFGIVATEPQSGDFGLDVIQPIVGSGATSTSLSVYWDDIEPSAGTYNPEINYLAIAELFYPPNGLAINLGFSVIDTNNKRLAPHVNNRAFNDPTVIADFNAMLTWAKTQIPMLNVKTLHIGNEVDIYLDQFPDEWPAWIAFFRQTSMHARSLWPNTAIGCKTTYNGINGPNRNATIELHNEADATLLTYYHMDGNFMVLPPTSIAPVFSNMASYPVDHPVYVLEIGVPSDSRNGGSEQHQAEFITEIFTAWDEHAEDVLHVEYFALTDFNPAIVEELLEYYGLDLEAFGSYLGSLGLRTWPDRGNDKTAWSRLLQELAARSWSA